MNPAIQATGPIPAIPARNRAGAEFIATKATWDVMPLPSGIAVVTTLHGDGVAAVADGIAHPPVPGRPWWLIEWAPGYPPAPEWATTAAAGMLADIDAQASREARAEKQAERRAEEDRETYQLLGGESL